MLDAVYQPFPTVGSALGHIWRHAVPTRRPRHFHAEPELNLVAAGTATFGVGATSIPVAAGDLLSWSPGQDHVLLDSSADFDLFVIGVTPTLSTRVLGGDGDDSHGGPTRVRLDARTTARLSARAAVPMQGQDPSVVERHVGDFWREAQALRKTAPNRHALTRRALACLLEHPNLCRSELARITRGYPTEVSRYFHRDMGLTLGAFRRRLRLLRFVQLTDEGATLLTAAMEAGFGSYSQCHRDFQRVFGCSPRAYFKTGLRRQMEDAFEVTWPGGA